MQISDKKQFNSQRTVAIIQARMGSTRLNGKIMRDLCGKPVLWHVIERVMRTKEIDDIVIATTTLPGDDVIADFCDRHLVNWYRGSESDVLSRYYHAARENRADTIVRITSDCPLYDPEIGDDVIRFYKSHSDSYDIVSNAGPRDTKRTSPPGTDTEVFSMRSLEDAFHHARHPYQREHVTPYIYENPANRFFSYLHDDDHSGLRLTLDTEEDYKLISIIYKRLYKKNRLFFLTDILDLHEELQDLKAINGKVRQKHYNE